MIDLHGEIPFHDGRDDTTPRNALSNAGSAIEAGRSSLQRLAQRAHESARGWGGVGGRANRLDQGRTDDYAIGQRPHFGGMFGGGDAEPHRQRQDRCTAHAIDERGQVGRQLVRAPVTPANDTR